MYPEQTQILSLPLVVLRRELAPHPWVFWKDVEKPSKPIRPGTVVDIVDRKQNWLGRGFYNGHARIRLRLLTQDPNERINEAFFRARIASAVEFRRDRLRLDRFCNAYRIVHSEGDGLGGVVIDRFGDLFVIEYFAAGMFRFSVVIEAMIRSHFPKAMFTSFAQRHVQKQESFDLRPQEVLPVIIEEHGIRFKVAPGRGHKTGFFLDQRDNRKFLADLCLGERALDLCCHSGAFSIYAMKLGGAAEVTGIDQDEEAINLGRQNGDLNGVKVNWVAEDIIGYLREAIQRGEKYGAVILDPSRQTRSRQGLGEALKRYHEMNTLAMNMVRKGGIFLSCSCTGLVKEEMFLEVLREASFSAGRTIQIFRISGASPDHPHLSHVGESRYLKAVWCRVK